MRGPEPDCADSAQSSKVSALFASLFRRHRVESSIRAPHGCCSIGWNRLRSSSLSAKPASSPSAIREIQQRISRVGGINRARHGSSNFSSAYARVVSSNRYCACVSSIRVAINDFSTRPAIASKISPVPAPSSPATCRAPSRVKWPTKGAMRRKDNSSLRQTADRSSIQCRLEGRCWELPSDGLVSSNSGRDTRRATVFLMPSAEPDPLQLDCQGYAIQLSAHFRDKRRLLVGETEASRSRRHALYKQLRCRISKPAFAVCSEPSGGYQGERTR